jgi:hypothetical protein
VIVCVTHLPLVVIVYAPVRTGVEALLYALTETLSPVAVVVVIVAAPLFVTTN